MDGQSIESSTDLKTTESEDHQSSNSMANLQSAENVADTQNTESTADLQSTENITNLQKTESTEDFQNIENTENLEPRQSDVSTDKNNENSVQCEKTSNNKKSEEKSQNSEKGSNFDKIENNAEIKTSIQTLEAEETEDLYIEAKELISKVFLMPMPDDFYKFFNLCKELKPSDPANAFKVADLRLVGPYDVLLGNINKETKITDNFLTHWRYFYDPPEFQVLHIFNFIHALIF